MTGLMEGIEVGVDCWMNDIPPIVGSLFSWKSLLTNRKTREDYSNSAMLVSPCIHRVSYSWTV